MPEYHNYCRDGRVPIATRESPKGEKRCDRKQEHGKKLPSKAVEGLGEGEKTRLISPRLGCCTVIRGSVREVVRDTHKDHKGSTGIKETHKECEPELSE